MVDEQEKRIASLTVRQREVYNLKQQGMKNTAIARELGITYNAVQQHIKNYERRLREYDRYYAAQLRNEEPVSISITRGEALIMINALGTYRLELENQVSRSYKYDWIGRLPYEYRIAGELSEKAQEAVYGKVISEQSTEFVNK